MLEVLGSLRKAPKLLISALGLLCFSLTIVGCAPLSEEDRACLETIESSLNTRLGVAEATYASFEEWGDATAAALDTELDLLAPYAEPSLENKEFSETVSGYISAVKSEREAFDILFDDPESFATLYHEKGLAVRSRCLETLESKFGMKVDEGHQEQLDVLRREAQLVPLGSGETVEGESDFGAVRLTLSGYHSASDFTGNFGRLLFEAENISYNDDYNPGFVKFYSFINIQSSDGITISPSSTAGEYDVYTPAAGAFGELNQGEKKRFCTEYLQPEGTDMVRAIVSGKDRDYVAYFPTSSSVQRVFDTAVSIPAASLVADESGNFSYGGLTIIPEDSQVSFGDTLGQGAAYHSYAACLEKYLTPDGDNYAELPPELPQEMFDREKPSTYDAFLKEFESQLRIISTGYPVGEVMHSLSMLEECTGTFDFESRYFNFHISSLSSAASKLGISKKLFGCILAWMTEYGAEISFSGDTCTVEMTYIASLELKPEDFSITNLNSDTPDGVQPGSNQFYCYALDQEPENSELKKEFGYTRRGVMTGHSKDAVVMSYGPAETRSYVASSDPLYQSVIGMEESADREAILRTLETGTTYLIYTYESSGQMMFVFNGENRLVAYATIGTIGY